MKNEKNEKKSQREIQDNNINHSFECMNGALSSPCHCGARVSHSATFCLWTAKTPGVMCPTQLFCQTTGFFWHREWDGGCRQLLRACWNDRAAACC